MDIKLEPEDEESHIDEEPQSPFWCDVPIKVSNSPDAHIDTKKHDEDADHTFEINIVTNIKCETEYQQIKCKDEPHEEPEHPIKYENSFGECSYSQYMPAYKSPHLDENFVDSHVSIQGQSLPYSTTPQKGIWPIPQRFSPESRPSPLFSGSQGFLNAQGPLIEDQVQVPLINIQNTIEKVKQIIQTQKDFENHQTQKHMNILENIVKNEVLIVSEKEAHLILNKASFYKRNFVCNICFEYFPTAKILKDHKLFIHDISKSSSNSTLNVIKSFACDQCNFKSTKASYLKTHQITHSSDKPFKCTECEFVSKRLANLKEHKLIHSDEKPFKCDECDYKCVQVSNLKRHKMVHSGEKPFECDLCDYKCISSSDFKAHKMTHSGEKPFKCDMCHYACTRLSQFRRHAMVHSDVKPFKCTLCSYECKESSKLKRHQMVHSGIKLFECNLCIYKCTQSSALRTHKMVHCGEKPFKCSLCDYRCTESSNLKKHHLIHSGEKPYVCDACDYKCTQSSSLKRHKLAMHGNKQANSELNTIGTLGHLC